VSEGSQRWNLRSGNPDLKQRCASSVPNQNEVSSKVHLETSFFKPSADLVYTELRQHADSVEVLHENRGATNP
jgi:hypothetical protein